VRRALVVLLVAGCACGGDASTEAAADAPSAGRPDAGIVTGPDGAPGCACQNGLVCSGGQCLTPPMLSVTNQGGTALARMEVWTVVWHGDEDLGATVDAFNAAVVASPYFTQNLAEYGVGAGVAKGVIVLGAPPTAVSDGFFNDLVPKLVGMPTTLGTTFGPPNDSTVVTFVIPKSTKEPVGTSYHTETTVTVASAGGGLIWMPYIVLDQISVGNVSDFDYLTWSQSHELAEAATDPLPDFEPAWFNLDVDIEGEVADLCNNIPDREVLDGTSYVLNRLYSQKLAAARMGDPCLPALATPYVNVALSPLTLTVPSGIGQTGTLHLHAFALAPSVAVHWQLYGDPSYTVTPAHGTILPGQDVDATVKRVSASPPYPTAFNVWVTSTASPDAAIPVQESFSGVTGGP